MGEKTRICGYAIITPGVLSGFMSLALGIHPSGPLNAVVALSLIIGITVIIVGILLPNK